MWNLLLPDIVESTRLIVRLQIHPKLQAGSEIISRVSSSSRLAFNITLLNEMETFSGETVGNLKKAIYTTLCKIPIIYTILSTRFL